MRTPFAVVQDPVVGPNGRCVGRSRGGFGGKADAPLDRAAAANDPKQTFASCTRMARAHLLPPSVISVEAYYGVSPYMAFSRPCA